jgi:hypothetical protein
MLRIALQQRETGRPEAVLSRRKTWESASQKLQLRLRQINGAVPRQWHGFLVRRNFSFAPARPDNAGARP